MSVPRASTTAVTSPARFECSTRISSGTPATRQCRNRPDRPSSAAIPYPNSTAFAAAATRPTRVAACRYSRHNPVVAAFHPPASSNISTTFATST